MINGRRVLALIPARGGSKRLPRKNILPLAGKPLIAWSIEAAQNSQYIDEIFVSTDNEEIAKIASQFGVNIPELRPESLASDTAKTESVLFYTLDNFAKDTDIVVLLQPTSPLRTAEHIDEALRLFFQKEAFSVVSVTECEHSPLWANVLSSDHSMENFIEKGAKQRSQDLGVYYRLNGAIYIFDVKKLRSYGEIRYTKESFAYLMKNEVSFDIDNHIDFELAEFFMNKNILRNSLH